MTEAIAHSRQTQPLLHSPHPDSLVLIATNHRSFSEDLPIPTEAKAIPVGVASAPLLQKVPSEVVQLNAQVRSCVCPSHQKAQPQH